MCQLGVYPQWSEEFAAGSGDLDEQGETVWTSMPGRAVVPEARLWNTADPSLYRCVARLLAPDGAELDRQETTFGFRIVQFKADGFYLNGKKTFLRGLNRHQSFPYIGYAAPEALQREDARILGGRYVRNLRAHPGQGGNRVSHRPHRSDGGRHSPLHC